MLVSIWREKKGTRKRRQSQQYNRAIECNKIYWFDSHFFACIFLKPVNYVRLVFKCELHSSFPLSLM